MDSDECWKVQFGDIFNLWRKLTLRASAIKQDNGWANNKDIFVQIFVELRMSGWKYMFSKKDLGQRFCQKVYLVISEKFLQNEVNFEIFKGEIIFST